MNQPLHDFSEPVLIRAIEENTKEFWNSITFGGQTTCLLAAFGCTNKKKARTEEQPSGVEPVPAPSKPGRRKKRSEPGAQDSETRAEAPNNVESETTARQVDSRDSLSKPESCAEDPLGHFRPNDMLSENPSHHRPSDESTARKRLETFRLSDRHVSFREKNTTTREAAICMLPTYCLSFERTGANKI